MTVFDDWEPEDSWDADDDVADQLDNLRARVRLLYRMRPAPPLDFLDDIAEAVALARVARPLSAREVLRADQLDEDIIYVRARL